MLGVCAAIIDIGTSWMFDLKDGICMDAFWLNREQCCWVANDTTFDQEGCTQVCTSACALHYYLHIIEFLAFGLAVSCFHRFGWVRQSFSCASLPACWHMLSTSCMPFLKLPAHAK